MTESEELKSPLMRVKEEREIASLKQHSKMKIMASGCITSQQRDGGKVEISSVQSLSHVWLFATPWTAVRQTSLSITNSWSLLKLMSFESVMSSNQLILCRPLLLLPSIFPSIRVFSNNSVLRIRWPKCWSFSLSISPSKIFRIDFL